MRTFQILNVSAVKSVNNVRKLLQSPAGASPMDPTRVFRPQPPWAVASKMKIIGVATGGPTISEPAKFLSFVQSKYVNSVCKLLQLIGASPLDPQGGLPSPDLWL